MDFIIENGVLKAYLGKPNVDKLVIPDGVTAIGACFLQEKVTARQLVISSSVKEIEYNAFDKLVCEDMIIDGNGKNLYVINDLPDNTKFFKVPKNCCSFCEHKSLWSSRHIGAIVLHRRVVLPEYLDCFEYVFFEKELTDNELRNYYPHKGPDKYLYDGVDYDSLEYVDELSTKGLRYFKTSKGIVIAEIDNRIAKWEDIPERLDGWIINSVNVFYPYDYEFDRKIDSKETKVKLTDLYTRLRYQAVENKKKIGEIVGKYASLGDYDKVFTIYGGDPLPEKKNIPVYLPQDVATDEEIYTEYAADLNLSAEKDVMTKDSISDNSFTQEDKKPAFMQRILQTAAYSKKYRYLYWTFALLALLWPLVAFAKNINDEKGVDLNVDLSIGGIYAIISIIAVVALVAAIAFRISVRQVCKKQNILPKLNISASAAFNEGHCYAVREMRAYLPDGYTNRVLFNIADDIVKHRVSEYNLNKTMSGLENAVRRSVSGNRTTYTAYDKNGNKIGTVEKKD